MREVEIAVDVSDAAGLGEPARIAATVLLPDPALLAERPIVCFARPSGSYTRAYYTSDIPGAGSGAQNAFHTARGWIFVALDTLGCGTDTLPVSDRERLDYAALAAATAAAEQEILMRLANGVLVPGYPPVNQPVVLGAGLALGAALAIYQQAHHGSYDGLVVLGFSAVHSHPATPPGGQPVTVAWYPRDARLEDCGEALNADALAAAEAAGRGGAAWAALAWGFHYDDVARDAVERDLQHYDAVGEGSGDDGSDGSSDAPWFARRTPERAARSTLTPGIVATEAAAIAVPVLAAMGERDLVPDPAGEPRAYTSAPSVDVFVCPRMGHVHNMAGTRTLLWERIDLFGRWCAALKAGG